MSPTDLAALAGALVAVVTVATFYLAYVRPHRALRAKAIDRLLGHDGSDGLPKEPSVFQVLTEIRATLVEHGEQLAHVVSEMPRNGRSLRATVDAVAQDVAQLKRDQETWRAALVAQNLRIPEPERDIA